MTLKRPSEIEAELKETIAREAPGNVKPTLLNLVVAQEETSASESFIRALSGTRPARIVSLLYAEGAEEAAYVSGVCSAGSGSRSVCFELIDLRGPSPVSDALSEPLSSSYWGPLLIRELPAIFLYLAEERRLSAFLSDARDRIDLAVIDSTRLGAIPAAFPSVPVADLAWMRGAPLRRLTAGLFEPTTGAALLPRLAALEVSGIPEPEAVLFGRWIGSKLDMLPESAAKAHAFRFVSRPEGEAMGINLEFEGGKSCSLRSSGRSCGEDREAACWILRRTDGTDERTVAKLPEDGRMLVALVDYPYDPAPYLRAAGRDYPP